MPNQHKGTPHMPTRLTASIDSPNFPHGTGTGYSAGCRKRLYDCPASPTCTEVHNARHAAYRARRAGRPVTDGRVTVNVRARNRKLEETTPRAVVAEYLGTTVEAITEWLALDLPVRTEDHMAAELDRAWAWFVYGNDLTQITEHGYNAYYRFT